MIVSIERCHNCGNNMRIELNEELDGNHVIECPHCQHEHCRVVERGKVTRERWDSRNGWGGGIVYYATVSTVSIATSNSTAGNTFTMGSWSTASTAY